MGGLPYHAVTFFFVLSGYLITYLLLAEKMQVERKQINLAISIKKFYFRRILRIFPVYFITIFLGFFIVNFDLFYVPTQTENVINNFWPALILSILFLSNLSFAIYHNLACIDQTWSVSVEEQFYLIWPFLVFFCKKKFFFVFMFFLIFIGLLARYCVHVKIIEQLLYLNRFGCMAIGALGAMLVQQPRTSLFKVTTSKIFFLLVSVLTIGFLFFPIIPNWLTPEVYSILFCLIIINLSVGAGKNLPLNSRPFKYLGNLSYSLYMYHNVFLALGCNLLISSQVTLIYSPQTLFSCNLLLYPFVCICTLIASALSYKWIESPILRLKDKKFSSEWNQLKKVYQ